LKTNDETAKSCTEWGHPRLCAALARDGRFELLQWVRSHDSPCLWGWQTGWEAFKRGDQAMLDWLAAHGYDPKEELALGMAEVARNVDKDHESVNGQELSEKTGDEGDLEYAGDLEMLKWMQMHGYNYFNVTEPVLCRLRYFAVTYHGHVDVLHWLHEIDAPLCLESLCNGAGLGGHIHVLEWLQQRGYLGAPCSCFAVAAGAWYQHGAAVLFCDSCGVWPPSCS
jgi:hypothetical protein